MMMTFSARAAQMSSSSNIGVRLLQLCEAKQTNLALSADVNESETLIKLAEQLGPEICVLKTHIDIVRDFSPSLTKTLREIADHHQFLIFEDRKFADIGNTVKSQFVSGIYEIANWADIVNAHSLPGPSVIEGLNAGMQQIDRECGILMIAEMSSRQNLLDQAYRTHTLQFARQFKTTVMGFITQHRLSSAQEDLAFINFTPGVQMQSGSDQLGQQYVTPEIAINKHGADIIIVGRGIIAAENPVQAARDYRSVGWECYLRTLR